ncbi:MAG TPA: hypothetical protein DDW52_22440 [Planctomycetaceae bacterium]|nr:hypothetical protein [Planctomycetaceae bacterium]
MAKRKKIDDGMRSLLLTQCGYMCANPVCRQTLTLELHHIEYVSEGGGNTLENLLPLCPNCHTLHHAGHIPKEAIKAWKLLLDSLTNPSRNLVDFLILLYRDKGEPEMQRGNVADINAPRDDVPFVFTGDSLPFLAGPVNSGLLEIFNRRQNTAYAGGTTPNFMVRLTGKGRALVESWIKGDVSGIRNALESEPYHENVLE